MVALLVLHVDGTDLYLRVSRGLRSRPGPSLCSRSQQERVAAQYATMFRRALFGAVIIGLAAIVFRLVSQEDDRFLFQPVQGKNNTVLFVTAEHPGYCNVHLATAYSLLEKHPQLSLHYASFPKVGSRVEKISALAAERGVKDAGISFYPLSGQPYTEAILNASGSMMGLRHAPGAAGIDSLTDIIQWTLAPWTAEDYLSIYQSLARVIDEVDPAVVVIDTFSPRASTRPGPRDGCTP